VKRLLPLLLIFVITGWSTALAQSKVIATVEVRDQTGAMLSGAEITIVATSQSQIREVSQTDSSGKALLDVLPGTYDLSVKMRGFPPVSKQLVITDAKGQTFAVVLPVGKCPPGPCLTVTGPTVSETYPPNYSEFLRLNGVIPDGETAIAVAMAVFKPVFSKEYTAKFVPYQARFNDGVWTVYGTLTQGSRGGTPMLKIQKSDGKVLEVWHSQ
jgi:NTF2 fold immunity protein of polymorphic toxin system component/carboxypeptidase family protein